MDQPGKIVREDRSSLLKGDSSVLRLIEQVLVVVPDKLKARHTYMIRTELRRVKTEFLSIHKRWKMLYNEWLWQITQSSSGQRYALQLNLAVVKYE